MSRALLDPTASAVDALLPLASADLRVPVLGGGHTRYVNLDNAASTPPLAAVQTAVAEAVPLYASVHRGAGYPSLVCTVAYEQARVAVADFVRARAGDVVVFTRNTTDALTLLSRSVPGDVVHLDLEHHANQLPWRSAGGNEVRVVRSASTVTATVEALDEALRAAPVALLAVTGASNVTGECPPLAELADVAHRHGARLAVDGAQLVPHRRVDVAATGIDYLAFSGHKVYAPYGSGVLIGRRDWLDAAAPHQPGGGAVEEVGLDSVRWTTSPARHEGGTPNVLGAMAIAAACRALGALPAGVLEAHEQVLFDQLTTGLSALGIGRLQVWPEHTDHVGIATFAVDGYEADEVATYLSAEHGIGVRDGRFCAHPLLTRLGAGRGAVRASLGVGSSSADVEALLGALRQLVTDGPARQYRRENGENGVLVPASDDRALPGWAGGAPLVPAPAPCAV